MEEWQERVVKERDELKEKCDKLRSFLNSEPFNKLNVQQQRLLSEQHLHMLAYLAVLGDRISLF